MIKHSIEEIKNKLQSIFGQLDLIGSGYHSFVFRSGNKALKVYRENTDFHLLEAEKMRRAGLDHLILDVLQIEDLSILVLPYFSGQTLCKNNIEPALPKFFAFLDRLHQKRNGQFVEQRVIEEKLVTFSRGFNDKDLDFLSNFVGETLKKDLFLVETSLCHLDLWCANILTNEKGEIFIADWIKSDWDDPARDLAIFTTGTLDHFSVEKAKKIALNKAKERGLEFVQRFKSYIALQTLNDLYWFKQNQPEKLAEIKEEKLNRALEIIKT